MAKVAPHSGVGVDRRTGKVISGWAHVQQSLQVIFVTSHGERVLRRWFGSFVPKLLGQNLDPPTVLKFWTAIIVAIDIWEPRYRVTQIRTAGSPEQIRTGALKFAIDGVYMPRGHLGDKTIEGPRRFYMGLGDARVSSAD